jgi:hypothetical protein
MLFSQAANITPLPAIRSMRSAKQGSLALTTMSNPFS